MKIKHDACQIIVCLNDMSIEIFRRFYMITLGHSLQVSFFQFQEPMGDNSSQVRDQGGKIS